MKALHSSFMLRILSSQSPVSLAISEHYNLIPKNLKAHPTEFVFKKPVSWLRLFFTGFLQPNLSKGLFLIHNKSKNHLVFQSTPLRCVSVFPVSNQDISSYTNIRLPRGSKIPLPYTKSNGTLHKSTHLYHLKQKYYSPSPSLKEIYQLLLAIHIPPPPLSTASTAKLSLHHLDKSIFQTLWKLKIRPFAKQFTYLYLLNSLPIFHGAPCIACQEPMDQNHLFQSCSFFLQLSNKSTTTITEWITLLSSIWLTYTSTNHNNNFHQSSTIILFNNIHKSETQRQLRIQHKQ